MIGDSHAAAFGEGCFSAGTAKATMGTGCYTLMNISETPKTSGNGMLTTICLSMEGRVDYTFEGAIVSCGATIEWLKNAMDYTKTVMKLNRWQRLFRIIMARISFPRSVV